MAEGYLAMTTGIDNSGRYQAMPSGLDLQRESNAKQEDKLELMERASRLRVEEAREMRRAGLDASSGQLAAIKAKAEYDAANFEKRYTSKQKADLAKLNNAEQMVDSSLFFSEAEKIASKRGIQLQRLGIKPVDMPRLSQNPPGMGIGDIWPQDGLGMVTRNPDGKIGVLQSWDKSAEQQAKKEAAALDKAHLQSNNLLFKHRLDLAKEDVEELGADGKVTYRKRTPEEIEEIIQRASGQRQQQNVGGSREAVAKMRADAGLPPAEQFQQLKRSFQLPQERGQPAGLPKPIEQIADIGSEDEYNSLPSGALYFGPDGKQRRKR
jgi:hypothetical protein